MSDTSLQDQIDDATLDFTLGDSDTAIEKLKTLAESEPESFGVWHALTEIYFAEGAYDAALEAGERAHSLRASPGISPRIVARKKGNRLVVNIVNTEGEARTVISE